MNNEALNHAYSLFANDGYTGSIDDFNKLMSSNNDALNHAHSLFTNDGYKGNIDDFKSLLTPGVYETEFYDFKKESKAYSSQITDFFEEVFKPEEEKGIEDIKETDREHPLYIR